VTRFDQFFDKPKTNDFFFFPGFPPSLAFQSLAFFSPQSCRLRCLLALRLWTRSSSFWSNLALPWGNNANLVLPSCHCHG
jgi:hypothetical protein